MTDSVNHSPDPPPTRSSHGVAKPLLLILSFLGGFQVMALEVCGFRILQMNLGSSVVVTGTLLTMVMVVLSVGYYLGGSLKSLHSPRALCLLLLGACAYTQLASVILLDRIGDLALDLRDQLDGMQFLEVGLPAALLSILLYGPPVLALSMISPCLIRLESERPSSDAGKTSGFIMSLSTVGSIFGTVLASYVLIPALGVRTAAMGTNAVLFVVLVLALVTSTRPSRRRLLAAAAVGGAMIVALLPVAHSVDGVTVLQDSESLYGRVRVVEDRDEQGRRFFAYQSTYSYYHSLIYPDEPLRGLVGSMFLAGALVEKSKDMLILGSAAGGAARLAQELLPDLQITGVDIDPAVHDVATTFFGVDPTKIRFVSRDARQLIEREDRKYDFIIVDTFAGEFVPAHLATREFFSRVKQRLTPNGVVFINTNMFDVPYELPAGSAEPARVNRHLERTLRDAGFPTIFANNFFHSAVLYPTPQSVETFRNKLLAIAAGDAQPAATRAALGLLAHTTFEAARYPRTYAPFTDAWSPEILLERKWNHAQLYAALAKTTATSDFSHPAARIIRDRLLAERAEGSRSGAIRDAGALVRALDRIDTPISPADRELAARYLRFDHEELPSLEPHSPWAKLAATYARLFAAGHANDHETLSKILAESSQDI